jgi:excisionase family DNA binding protein
VTSPLRNYAEAAEYVRLSATELRRRVSAGQVTTVRYGRRVMFTQADLDAFIDAQRVTAGPSPSHAAAPSRARHLRSVTAGGPNLDAVRRAR